MIRVVPRLLRQIFKTIRLRVHWSHVRTKQPSDADAQFISLQVSDVQCSKGFEMLMYGTSARHAGGPGIEPGQGRNVIFW